MPIAEPDSYAEQKGKTKPHPKTRRRKALQRGLGGETEENSQIGPKNLYFVVGREPSRELAQDERQYQSTVFTAINPGQNRQGNEEHGKLPRSQARGGH